MSFSRFSKNKKKILASSTNSDIASNSKVFLAVFHST
jgi:hypothetical protein